MRCEEVTEVADAYLDHELNAQQKTAVAAHLRTCAACEQTLQRATAWRTATADSLDRFEPSEALKKRVAAAIRQEAQRPPRTSGRWRGRSPTLMAAAFALVLGLALARPVYHEQRLMDEVVSAHIRSLLVAHATDISSSDQHTVKPWFTGKLDYSPPVVDLAAQGFPLLGGRLDYINHKTVAALVYGYRLHRINVFVWPDSPPTTTTITREHGYQVVRMSVNGMRYWIISDVNPTSLKQFAALLRA